MPKVRSASLSRQYTRTCETLLQYLYTSRNYTADSAEFRKLERSMRDPEWQRDSLVKALLLVGAIEQLGQKSSAKYVLTGYGIDLLNSYRYRK